MFFLRFFFYDNFQLRSNLRMEFYIYDMGAECFNILFENYLFLIHIKFHLLFDCRRDLLAGYRAERPAAFSYFDSKLYFSGSQLCRQFFCRFQIFLSYFLLIIFLEFQVIEILRRSLCPELFRQNKISCISVIYFYDLSFFSERFYIL